MRRVLGIAAIAATSIAAVPTTVGGWAVISVEDVPTHLEVGKTTQLTFDVLQHGRTPLSGLSPTVTIRKETARFYQRGDRLRAQATSTPGQYTVAFAPEDTGAVEITIDANWQIARIELLPMRVVAAGVTPETMPRYEWGRALFVAKGCVDCHMKRDDPAMPDRNQVQVGPELTGRRFADDWLVLKLTDPSVNRVRYNRGAEMPDLHLTRVEIDALVSYVNGVSVAASR